ncbi:MAG: putative flagellar hook-length control protein FliK [Burkholderiaceae bacterium]|nr:putative flagellar hook-length control protein FliK [Burkholderiaceae bacterium]
MNTATIKTPIVAMTGNTAKSPASATNSVAPDESFNQVLSKEMSDRSSAARSGNAQATEKSTTSRQPTKSAEKTASNSSDDSDEATQTDASNTDTTHLLVLVAELSAVAESPSQQTASSTESSTEAAALMLSQNTEAAALMLSQNPASQAVAQTSQPLETKTGEIVADGVIQAPDNASDRAITFDAQRTEQTTNLAATIKTTDNAQALNQPVGDFHETISSALTQTQTQPATTEPVAAAIENNLSTVSGESHTPNAIALAPMHQVSTALVQTAANITEKLTPRVGTSDWNQALGQKVVWMVNSDVQSASMTLNPPDLGPLQVVLSVSNNQASANFVAAQPEVRQALEAALPRLREMLGDAGIQLGHANVSAGTQQQQHSNQGQQQMHASSARGSGNEGIFVSQTDSVVTPRSSRQGMVDTFA